MTIFPHRPIFTPIANPDSIVLTPNARFTILTSRLIRLEYSSNKRFIDQPSQAFWYRLQPVPKFDVTKGDNLLQIETDYLVLIYKFDKIDKFPRFNSSNLSIRLKEKPSIWKYGDSPQSAGNLLGTARTLDRANGLIELEPGLMSRKGWALIDDSESLLFNNNGWLQTRPDPNNLDIYFFGYGSDYLECLGDYYKITGNPPLIPRWVLGNWWSRYWAYTQEELVSLIDEFETQQTPLSVMIIDMDWHLKGWTGYTWNRDLFPNPEGLIQWLHSKGLKTALNLHPADGVGPHEEKYEQFAEAMGLDPEIKERIPFDCVNPNYMQTYFEILHHPQEAIGIDFWWVDWQQGTQSKLSGMDPLWWLNHLHFYDIGRDGKKRPITFSRWGGLGNHRYPIGFSGDTVITWQSLEFQPYFTATAANVGYGWWSHDIGGHMGGIEEDELYIRWLQFGVFSPILRLHSTNNPFHERAPWRRSKTAASIGKAMLRLRHNLIPYIYSMAWRDHDQGIPLITPLYYKNPDDDAAYNCPQAYYFGSELIAAPFTTPVQETVNLSRQLVWLPQNGTESNQDGLQTPQTATEGYWYDFFTGERYTGGEWHIIYGDIEVIPLFARSGAIIPLSAMIDWNDIKNPQELAIHVFPGANNQFGLYEDDGESNDFQLGHYAITRFKLEWSKDTLQFHIDPVNGDISRVPPKRKYIIVVHAIQEPGQVGLTINEKKASPVWAYDKELQEFHLEIERLLPKDELTLTLRSYTSSLLIQRDQHIDNINQLLSAFHLDTWIKAEISENLPDILTGEVSLEKYRPVLTDQQFIALSDMILVHKK